MHFAFSEWCGLSSTAPYGSRTDLITGFTSVSLLVGFPPGPRYGAVTRIVLWNRTRHAPG